MPDREKTESQIPDVQTINGASIDDLLNQFSEEENSEILANRKAKELFIPEEWETINKLIGLKDDGKLLWGYLSSKADTNQAQYLRLLILYQRFFLFSKQRFADCQAVLKEVTKLGESSDQLMDVREAVLAKLMRARIAMGRNHDFHEAKKIFLEILDDIQKLEPQERYGSDLIETNAKFNLAMIESRLGNAEEALDHHQDVLFRLRASPNLSHEILTKFAFLTPRIYQRLGKHEEAIQIAERLLDTFRQAETSITGKTEENQPKAIQLIARQIKERPAELIEDKHEIVSALASSQASQGDPSLAHQMLRELEQVEDAGKLLGDSKFEHFQSKGELALVLGSHYARKAEQMAAQKESRVDLDTALNTNGDETIVSFFNIPKEAAQKYFDISVASYRRVELLFHASEAGLNQAETEEREHGKIQQLNDYKQGLFKLLEEAEQHLGLPFYVLLGIGDLGKYQPPPLSKAQQQIERLYPADSSRESYAKFLRDYARQMVKELKVAVGQHLPESESDQPATCDQIFQTGKNVFGFRQMYAFAGEELTYTSEGTASFRIADLVGLQDELIEYAQRKNWPTQDYDAVLDRIREEDQVVALRHFYFNGIATANSQRATETMLLTYSGDQLMLITCDPKCYKSYNFIEQIMLRKLLKSLNPTKTTDMSNFIDEIVEKSKIITCEKGSPDERLILDLIIRTFIEAYGEETPTTGSTIALEKPYPVQYGDLQISDPFAAVMVSNLHDTPIGESRIEKYYLQSTDEKIGGVDRNKIGQVGGLARLREYGSSVKMYAKLFVAIADYGHQNGNTHHLLTANSLLVKILNELGIPYEELAAANTDQLSDEEAEKRKKYFGLKPVVILIKGQDAIAACKAKFENLS